MNEFQIIEHYFNQRFRVDNDILIGQGDDAAVLAATGRARVVCMDTLNEDVHFPKDALAGDVGYKALAVNLSDLAAMGVKPQYALLALSLPHAEKKWLDAFAESFFALAKQYGVELIGGDLTRGSLSVTVTLMGEPCNGNYLTRSGAKVGDAIYLTGKVGGSAKALANIQSGKTLSKELHQYFYRPVPRVEIGMALSDVANSAIDLSDGLLADLQHILDASKVGAIMNLSAIPHVGDLEDALVGGEDYELCFTASVESDKTIQSLATMHNCTVTKIGEIVSEPGLVDENKKPIKVTKQGYQHF